MSEKTIDLNLTTMLHGGNVMGKHRGRPVFVPYAIPGEVITARILIGALKEMDESIPIELLMEGTKNKEEYFEQFS